MNNGHFGKTLFRRGGIVPTSWHRPFLAILLIAAIFGGLAFTNDRPKPGSIGDYDRLLAQQSPALVTLKYVLKTEDEEGTPFEEDREITAVLIDPSGVVLCSNAQLAGATAPEDFDVKASASDIKVMVGDDTDGLEARVLTRDRELDLVWLRVKNPAGKKLPFVDLSKSVDVHRGDRLLTIVRLEKFFDHEPVVYEGPVAGILRKPRDLYAPGSGFGGEAGLPVFNADGGFVGIFVAQMPEREDHQADATATAGNLDVFILPAKTVADATKRAMKVRE